MNLPYRIQNFAGIGGTIKNRAEDFFVQELPLYDPSGEGEHVYCEIQKVGMTTFDAINRISAALGVSTRDIGYAGMKDARAVSQQVLSIFGTNEQAVMDLKIPGVTIQWAARHGNKLRLGHLTRQSLRDSHSRCRPKRRLQSQASVRRTRVARDAQLFRRAAVRSAW